MLPYFTIPPLELPDGSLVYPFGVCILAACLSVPLVGLLVAGRRAMVAPLLAAPGFFWVGIPVGHLAFLAAFAPEKLGDPTELMAFHQGFEFPAIALSTFAVGAVGAWIGVASEHRWRALDAVAAGLIAAWWWYRLGNTLSHDHPGRRSTFALAVQGICPGEIYPERACHDLGMYEWVLATLVLLLAAVVFWRRPGRGLLVALPLLAYPAFRLATFPLVVRHPHAIYAVVEALVGLLAFGAGVALLRRGLRREETVPAA